MLIRGQCCIVLSPAIGVKRGDHIHGHEAHPQHWIRSRRVYLRDCRRTPTRCVWAAEDALVRDGRLDRIISNCRGDSSGICEYGVEDEFLGVDRLHLCVWSYLRVWLHGHAADLSGGGDGERYAG